MPNSIQNSQLPLCAAYGVQKGVVDVYALFAAAMNAVCEPL